MVKAYEITMELYDPITKTTEIVTEEDLLALKEKHEKYDMADWEEEDRQWEMAMEMRAWRLKQQQEQK